jgi:hypothetical protein
VIGRICIVLGTLYCLHGADRTSLQTEKVPAHAHNKPLAAGLDLPALGIAGFCADQSALCKQLAVQTVTHVIADRLDTQRSPSREPKMAGDGLPLHTPLLVSAPLPPRRMTPLERQALKQQIMRAI